MVTSLHPLLPVDLEHMRTVKKDKHNQLVQQHGMSSHFVSAKSNDMVDNCFLKITAEALGIRLTASELDKTAVSFTISC